MKVIILGGNGAGLSAAGRLARRGKGIETVIYEKSDTPAYGACGLPFYIADINKDINLMKMRTTEALIKSGLNLRIKHEAISVSPENKTVTIRNLNDGTEFVDSYDKLLVASGASSIIVPMEGLDLDNIFSLKTLNDGARIKEALQRSDVKTVAIIGGGYIGLEVAEAIVLQKKKLLLIESLEHVLNVYDEEFSAAVENTLLKHGANLHLNEKVIKLEGNGKVERVVTDKGAYATDMVIFAIGVRPNTAIFAPGSIEKLPNGAIVTDDQMKSSVPDIYAAGDCATVFHGILKKPVYLPLGTNANKQGRLVADVILGADVHLDRALGTSMLRCLDLELAKTGLGEKDAIANKINYSTVTVVAHSHAVYYPDFADLTIKLIYEKESKVLLGAQLMGEKECALRVDILACAIDRRMTTTELGFLDLGYAPPYSHVWDAVQIAANAAK